MMETATHNLASYLAPPCVYTRTTRLRFHPTNATSDTAMIDAWIASVAPLVTTTSVSGS